MLGQLTELLTNYGEIGAIWFDGQWDQPADFNWRMREIYDHIHSIQPGCLIINNHHLAPAEGEDGQTFEKDLPGQNKSGYSSTATIGQLPLETCETMNNSWGYNITDKNYKSEKDLIHYIVKAAGNNANLLMNVGPRPDGTFPDIAVSRYNAMGEWLKTYGETIYGTRGGFIAPHDWGVTTQKGNKLYVHILNLQDEALYLPMQGKRVVTAKMFLDKKAGKIYQGCGWYCFATGYSTQRNRKCSRIGFGINAFSEIKNVLLNVNKEGKRDGQKEPRKGCLFQVWVKRLPFFVPDLD